METTTTPLEQAIANLKLTAFETLSNTVGLETAIEILKAFKPEIETRLREAEQAFNDKSYNDLARHAHSLKGVATTLGAQLIKESAISLERAARNAEKQYGHDHTPSLDLQNALQELTSACAKMLPALDKFMETV